MPKASSLWEEFSKADSCLCGLCGNYGIINTLGKIHSPAGVGCGVRRYCICPNGRVMKRKINQVLKKDGKEPSDVPPMMEGRP